MPGGPAPNFCPPWCLQYKSTRCLLNLSPTNPLPPAPQTNPLLSSRLVWVPASITLFRHMPINQKSGRQTFRRRFVSGSLFVSPCPPECYLQIETKIEPGLRSLSLKTVSFTQEPMGSWFTLLSAAFPIGVMYETLYSSNGGKRINCSFSEPALE